MYMYIMWYALKNDEATPYYSPKFSLPDAFTKMYVMTYMYNVHVSGSWQQQKIILKSLSNWYLAQAYDRGIIFNFLIVLGKKWSWEQM